MREAVFATIDLEAALRALTPKQQACLRGHLEGYTYREIAAQLGISLPTVQEHLRAAQTKLRRYFEASADSI
jgi:RNA polymerase sigma factor (sigma-70 family)